MSSPSLQPNHVTGLMNDRGFQSEAAQVQTKALLTEIVDELPNYHWSYVARRLVRNVTAATFELEAIAGRGDHLQDGLVSAGQRIAYLWESLAKLQESTGEITALLNAAVCYDLAGYQANAACIAEHVRRNKQFKSLPLLIDLATLFLQRRFLTLQVSTIPALLEPDGDALSNQEYLERLGQGMAAKAFERAAAFFLSGSRRALEDANQLLTDSRTLFYDLGEVDSSNIMRSTSCLLPLMASRSIWNVLQRFASDQPKWIRYLKLLARGPGLNIVRSRSISELWPSQLAALDRGLLDSETSKVIRMPTSAGKTRIAELAIVHTLIQHPGSKCVYVAPYRALVSELEQSLANLMSDIGFGVSSVVGSYEIDDFEELLFREADVFITTPEKLDLLLRAHPDSMSSIKLVVLDEAQILEDQRRGIKYELLITRLKRRHPDARFLVLSAVVPEQTLADFADWFNISRDRDISTSSWRPSIQRYALLDWRETSGVLRYERDDANDVLNQFVPGVISQRQYVYTNPKTGRQIHRTFPESNNKAQIAAELAFKFSELGPVLVFCSTRPFVEAVAKALKQRIDLLSLTGQAIPAYFQSEHETSTLFASTTQPPENRAALLAREWLGSREITSWLQSGIGVHFGDLPDAIRTAVEADFRQKKLRVLIATNTLAQGVNMPVKTVIVHSCHRYIEDEQRPIPARDYWNIAGRAGRAGEETEGLVIHIRSGNSSQRDFDYYRQHRTEVEPVNSALLRALTELAQERLTLDSLDVELDSDIMALLVEENAQDSDLVSFADVLDSSLASVQARRMDVDMPSLKQVFSTGARQVLDRIPDRAYLNTFSATGLSSASCLSFYKHIKAHSSEVRRFLVDGTVEQRSELIAFLLPACLGIDEMQPAKEFAGSYEDLLSSWTDGVDLAEILRVYSEPAGGPENLGRLIDDLFRYRLPWGISAYMQIARNILDIGRFDSSDLTNFAPAMVKFGLPTPFACWVMATGIASRRVAMQMAAAYRRETSAPAYEDFIGWLSALDVERLANEFKLSGPILEDVARVVLSAGRNPLFREYSNVDTYLPRELQIQGIRYESRALAAENVEPGQELDLVRDYFNTIDRNAVIVRIHGQDLGYLPRQAAQFLAPEIDTGARVKAVVTRVVHRRIRAIWVELSLREDSDTDLYSVE